MATRQLSPISRLHQSLAPTFRAAAPEPLVWAQEKTFFEAIVRSHWQIERAIENQVTDTIESLKVAVREAASMGLSMSPTAQLVYFIPRRARKRWTNESKSDYERLVPWLIHCHPSYRGLAYIGTHYAGCEAFAAEVVYSADRFRYFGPLQMYEHEPTLDNKKRIESHAVGVYACVIMQSGVVRVEYVDAPTIAKIRACSEFPGGLMWTKLWTEGWKKAAIRRLCKLANITQPHMQAALGALDRYEGVVIEDGVPRETQDRRKRLRPSTASEDESAAGLDAKGMHGLRMSLDRSERRQSIAKDTVELDPADREPVTIETESRPDADAAHDQVLIPAEDTDHPALSLEWWAEKLHAATTLDALSDLADEIRARGADRDDDADQLRAMYTARRDEIRSNDEITR